jgi:phage head maturation protease
MAKTFILSDESVNSYGFRILTAGINLQQFKKNPVMLFNHRSWGENYSGPIGKWENIRVEDNKLMADAIFDENDELAQKIKLKVEGGFIKGASIGFSTIETSVETSVITKGQTRPTVTKALVYEASIVDLPGNMSALALYDKSGNRIELSKDNDIEQLNNFLPLLKQNSNTMTQLKLATATLAILALNADASEQDVDTAVKKLADDKKALQDKLSAIHKKNAETLVENSIKDKKIKEADKDKFIQLAMQDFDLANSTLGAIAPVQLPNQQLHLQTNHTNQTEREDWTLKDWMQKDAEGLRKMKTENPEAYKQLGLKAMSQASTQQYS